MRKSSRKRTFGSRPGDRFIGSSAGLAALLLSSTPLAWGQNADPAPTPAAPAAPDAPKPADATELDEVVVVGARASQQASINRKKTGKTAMDSISAEDVGKFPDQNVNEAISRVAGVALDRGDNGEGQGISIRGNGMEATRVEIDGMSVLNTNGALSGGAGAATGGRAADLRELPAAIIKTIDVFKGTTADMTEGSLGGSVQIETRNGLEFDKPFFQLATDGQQNSITEKMTPSGSAFFGRTFMDGRFGIVGNVNYSEFETISDIQQPQTSGNAGPSRNADFDQSPEQDLHLRSEHRRPDRDGREFPRSWARWRADVCVAVAHRHPDEIGCGCDSCGLPRGVPCPDDDAIERDSGGRPGSRLCRDIRRHRC